MLHESALEALFSLTKEEQLSGLAICDLACGQGIVARRVAEQQHPSEVWGIDISEKLLEIAQQEEAACPRGIRYLLDDAQTLATVEDARFDGVLCNLALMDIASLGQVAQTIWRVLRPNGWVVICLLHPCAPTTTPEGTLMHRNYFEEGFWLSPNKLSVRGLVGAHHRTISTYINAFLQAGLRLEASCEPQATGPLAERIEGYTQLPSVWVLRWRKGP
jgi:ubiquinone/menaquinone biosynthesis C-methylase UbiE